MSYGQLVVALTVAWAALTALSYVHAFVIVDDGTGRGFTPMFYFLGWQAIALLPAFLALGLGIFLGSRLKKWVRVIGFIPAVGFLMELGAMQAAIIMYR